ncbi:MAG: Ni/Fe-hydrogenase cytochrome b subunit [bacterium]|jgi:formate dehydrogenase iron-sulfur subunit|nr:Ni/Fe-hydrogenase cytochrome b subunit [bacterium]
MIDFLKRTSPGLLALYILAAVGLLLIGYRFVMGLGAVTNLSDSYPWGLWIGVDVLAGIALAAGGFVVAGSVHLFGLTRFHSLTRPAIATAFLGYLIFIFGLIVDLGRPWNLWRAIFNWNHSSPMFEVAWCVMLYTSVLLLEFLPPVFERFRLSALHEHWKRLAPWFIVFILTLFTFAMTDSVVWAVVMLAILMGWELLFRLKLSSRSIQMPLLMIMAGVMFSTMHQSSLGTLFTLVPHRLHALWYSPMLPVLFLLSAIMVAPAMVIVECFASEKGLGHKLDIRPLTSFARAMPWLLGTYLLVKIVDLVLRGAVYDALAISWQSWSWWGELLVGVVLPFALFLSRDVREKRGGLLTSAALVVIGLLWNRINVTVVGMIDPDGSVYHPYWAEILITLGLISLGILAYRVISMYLPIHGHADPATS